jgi:hypothetical protein
MSTTPQWRTSSYSSGEGGNCVEIASAAGVVAVRDSKDPDGPAFGFARHEWRAFLAAVKKSGR